MKIEDLKLKLIEMVLEIEDEAFLNSLLEVIENSEKNSLTEPDETYPTQSVELSPAQLEELDRRSKAYESGEERTIPWDEVKKEIEEKNGF